MHSALLATESPKLLMHSDNHALPPGKELLVGYHIEKFTQSDRLRVWHGKILCDTALMMEQLLDKEY